MANRRERFSAKLSTSESLREPGLVLASVESASEFSTVFLDLMTYKLDRKRHRWRRIDLLVNLMPNLIDRAGCFVVATDSARERMELSLIK